MDPDPRRQRRGGRARCSTPCAPTWTRSSRALDALGRRADGGRRPGRARRGAGSWPQGNAGHARIPGKHGAAPTAYAAVPVLVPDEPGELARLLHDVGDAGVNLEDLRLEHGLGQPVGLAEVVGAARGRASRWSTALRQRGWRVHD